MVTIHDKGSDNIRLMSGSCHVMTKKTLIWVLMCKEKRMKNGGEGNFRYNAAPNKPQACEIDKPGRTHTTHIDVNNCRKPVALLLTVVKCLAQT